ncbi:sorbin and SH3 domain-containing protein 2-like isoform X2 [Varroa jacobsoni]|uniref:Sorbin and SH3 domain-containing protein 1 n=1 Tax=Varroa destructor TaxID=109461 RepID=A0A7M7JCQ8_VARDE|nr:sorbin and SH3 domain-containing protein 2-like isoform X2 [Varroa destructor]XP_022691696.1 sorbin and SH3 domain-containing protein 2-like isoform X2 [Varroa jacobsoni]
MPAGTIGESDEDDYIIPAASRAAATPAAIEAPDPSAPSSDLTSAVSLASPRGLPATENPTVTLLRAARENSTERRSSPVTTSATGEKSVQKYSVANLPLLNCAPANTTLIEGFVTKHKSTPKVHGVGPTENGVPITPRGNIDDEHGRDWYRTMYKRLHTYRKPQADQEVITVRVKRGLAHYRDDGYVSEPEHTPAERRRFSEKRWPYEHPEYQRLSSESNEQKTYSSYRVKPKRIEDYQPGDSSVSAVDSAVQRDKMYHQHKYNPPVPTPPKPAYVPLLSVFNDDDSYRMVKLAQDLPPITASNATQRDWYRSVQKGHDIPLGGLRKPQPSPPKELRVGPCPVVQSSNPYEFDFCDAYKFLESQNLALERDYEDLKAMRQRKEEELQQFREEAQIKKQIQNEVDQEMRRYHDTLLSGNKSPVPGNRYDGSAYETVFFTPDNKEVIMLGRVIYDFVAHAPRELNLKKGDLVYIFKKIDRNWYEGECLGRSGIFPVKYVDVFPPSSIDTLAGIKVQEGSAIGRFNFPAKSATELSFRVGDKLQLIRRIDHNWFEAKIGTRRGLVPENYLTVVAEPSEIRVPK